MFAVGRIGKSTYNGRKASTLQGAANHNRRTIQAEMGAKGHIDVGRSHLNETIHGPDTPNGVTALAESMTLAAGIDVKKLRKDYTQAVELLFSLPVDAVIDDGLFFRRCVAWTGERLGLANILSADIHRDESAPHCHVLVLPLVDGKMQGSSLIDRAATAALRDSFYAEVAAPFGLKKPVDRIKGASKSVAVQAVLDAIEASTDVMMSSPLWTVVKRSIEQNPAPFMESLGIELQRHKQKAMRTVAQIFTSTGKGPKTASSTELVSIAPATKPIGFQGDTPKPIGFEKHSEDDQNLSCVGFDTPTRIVSNHPAKPGASPSSQAFKRAVALLAQQSAIQRHAKPLRPFEPTGDTSTVGTREYHRIHDADPLPPDW